MPSRLSVEDLLRPPTPHAVSDHTNPLVSVGHNLLYSLVKPPVPKIPANQHKPWVSKPTTPPLEMKRDPIIRERGSSNVVLIPSGIAELTDRAERFAQQVRASHREGKPIEVCLYSSPWTRTLESAKILQKHLPGRVELEVIPELAPQSLGSIEGAPVEQVRELVNRLRTVAPDEVPPGTSAFTGQPAESYNRYIRRVIPAIHKMMREVEAKPMTIDVVLAHSGDMRVVQGWINAGMPSDYRIDLTHVKDDVPSARTDRVALNKHGKWIYNVGVRLGGDRPLPLGLYLQRHGTVEFSTDHRGN